MYINSELAQMVHEKAQAILQRKLVISDTKGLVLAGSQNEQYISDNALKSSLEGRTITSEEHGRKIQWTPFVYENQTIGVFGIELDEGKITPEAINLVQGLAEVIVHQHFLIDKLQSIENLRADFIKNVLQNQNLTSDEVYRQADILQINMRSPQAVILVYLEDFEQEITDKLKLTADERAIHVAKATDTISIAIRQAFMNYKDNVACYAGKNCFIVLKGIGGDMVNTLNSIKFLKEKAVYLQVTLKILHHNSVTLGVGQYYPELGGLRKSYQDAKLALNIGVKVWGTSKIHHIKEVGMFITLANINQDRKAELAHQILSPLISNSQLFKTVETFLTCSLNLTEAAGKLHIHRNTLIYRLDKTKKLIGLDPRRFEDALQIKLGLMFYQP